MNILHHKSWHVRNKDNIARVRRDEAKAKAELDEKERKIALAEQEVKLNYLRGKAKTNHQNHTITSDDQLELPDETPVENNESSTRKLKHINFFADLEDGVEVSAKGNEKYLKEKKEEQEKYEKQIGYLTYLGQDTNESLGKRDWYDLAPTKIDAYDERGKKLEVGLKAKNYNDPLNVMKKYIKETEKLHNTKANLLADAKLKTLFPIAIDPVYKPPLQDLKHHKKKSKKSSKSKKQKKDKSKEKEKKRSRLRSELETRQSAEKNEKLLRLRAERLKREEVERNRTKLLLAKYTNVVEEPKIVKAPSEPWELPVKEPIKVKQKYNSQFNPEIAKQNYEDIRRY